MKKTYSFLLLYNKQTGIKVVFYILYIYNNKAFFFFFNNTQQQQILTPCF